MFHRLELQHRSRFLRLNYVNAAFYATIKTNTDNILITDIKKPAKPAWGRCYFSESVFVTAK